MATPLKPPDPTPEAPVIDAELMAELTGHQAADPVSPVLAARIKHRVLDRIARSESSHLTVPSTGGEWQAFKHGVDIKVLHEANGVMSYLLRLAPGAVVDAHRHPIDEECVVLQGTVRIGDELTVLAGGFHLAHQNTLHAPISSELGATLFLRGASPHVTDLV
jgi:quercetin dioxygenase-like cupin family protein